ncbi:MAG: MFS transporter [Holosporales bacterium]|jgi:MFS family permease|nr:MFS transporter [Holosporales bacterium]
MTENQQSAKGRSVVPNFIRKIPGTIWTLSFVSLLMNSSSTIISSLSPIFIIGLLGGNSLDLGFVRGITEALAYVIKLCSGVLSDYIGRRKILVLIGYAAAIFTKPIFMMATSVFTYMSAQTIERVANGLRDTPRDALVADTSPKGMKGTCFGLRQGMASLGSTIGGIFCWQILSHLGDDEPSIRAVYIIAIIPIVLAVLLLCFGVKDAVGITALKKRKGFPIKREDLRELGGEYWYFIFVSLVFMMSRFSESFLVYRAQTLGLGVQYQALILTIMYLFYTPTVKLVGIWSDNADRRQFLAAGFIFMIVSCAILGSATEIWQVFLGVAVYGVHFGATQGTLYALVSDYSLKHLKGTTFGIFNVTCAIGMCSSSILMGYLWDRHSAEVAFYVNAGIAVVATFFLLFLKPSQRDS